MYPHSTKYWDALYCGLLPGETRFSLFNCNSDNLHTKWSCYDGIELRNLRHLGMHPYGVKCTIELLSSQLPMAAATSGGCDQVVPWVVLPQLPIQVEAKQSVHYSYQIPPNMMDPMMVSYWDNCPIVGSPIVYSVLAGDDCKTAATTQLFWLVIARSPNPQPLLVTLCNERIL